MTPRERIKLAFSHKKPDRLPRYEIFFPAFIKEWRQKMNQPEDMDIYDYYGKIDIGGILASQAGPFMNLQETREDTDYRYIRDSWGRLQRHSKTGKLFEVLETAIKEKSDLDKLVFEDPADPEREDLKNLVQAEKSFHDRFAPVSGVMGLFMPSYYLRGEVNFLMDFMDDEPFCRELIARVAEFITVLGEKVIEQTDTWDTALWVYDDFGSNHGPLVSPDIFERFFVPVYKKMISSWKSKGLKNVILHYDSNCWVIMDMLIECGFTGIQGIYPGANMSIPEVKSRYGDQLILIGGICNIRDLAMGTKQEIESAVASIAEVAQDGGVVIGAHSIEEDILPENYNYYYSIIDKFDEKWSVKC